MKFWKRKHVARELDPVVQAAREKADEALRRLQELRRHQDDADPWERELGASAPPYKPTGEE